MSSYQYISVPEPVDWRQGMLISPQHFQQQDAYIERLTTHKMFVSQPHYWGLTDISIRENDLASNKIVIDRLNGILRDGQIIEISGGRRLEAELPDPNTLSDSEDDQGLDVHVKNHIRNQSSDKQINVRIGVFRSDSTSEASFQKRPQQRFHSVDYRNVPDENNANQTIDMRKKRVFVQIFIDEEVPDIFETITLFSLVRAQTGYKLAAQHPPMLDARVSQILFAKDSIWAKTEDLVTAIKNKASEMEGANIKRSAEVHSLSMMLSKVPALEVLLQMEMVHPFQLYMALVDLAASVVSMSLSNKPLSPARYEHDAPNKCFEKIFARLETHLEAIKPDFTTYIFDNEDGKEGQYSLDLPDGVDLKQLIIRVVPEKGQHPGALLPWIEKAKIAPATQMDRIRKRRLNGLSRKVLTNKKCEALGLPATGLTLVLSNEGNEAKIIARAKLQIQGSSEDYPAKIYLCVPASSSIKAWRANPS